jgi:hypothetical protein
MPFDICLGIAAGSKRSMSSAPLYGLMQHQDLTISGLIDYGAQVRTVSFAPHIAFVCDAAAGSNIDGSDINSGNCT